MRLRFLYRALRARFRDQRREIQAILGALQPGDVAVDAGAYKGSYLYWMSRAAAGGRVVAFEPQPELSAYLQRASCSLGLRNVTVESAGLSDHRGRGTLSVLGAGTWPGASFESVVAARGPCRRLDVAVVSLDEYFRGEPRRIGAIKVDVEGHELQVFRGAERILREHSPLLVFECEQRNLSQGTVSDVLAHLRARGYDGFFVQRSRLVPISEFRPDVHQKAGGVRPWKRPDYCNNFIMTRQG
jgi:FkbM family methyltransferase